MRIGSAWTNKTKEGEKPFISVVFDEAFLELCPQLKNCNMLCSYIDPADRKSEKWPSWNVNLIAKKDDAQSNHNTTQTANNANDKNGEMSNAEIPF